MVCEVCAYAADRNKPGLHKMCKSPATCSCQHFERGYGRRPEIETTEGMREAA